jgi:hypothetical protein
MHGIDGFHDLSSIVVVLEVLNKGVSAWKQQSLTTGVSPAHQVGRRAICPANFEYFSVVIGLTDMVPLDHDSVTNGCTHLRSPSSGLIISTHIRGR